MDGWIPVECPFCKGTGSHEEPGWERHPNSFRYVPCETCKGNRIMMARAVELKPVDPKCDKEKA